MLGLRHTEVVARHHRAGQPDAAGNLRRFVRQDVAEHIGGDDDVELRRIAYQQSGHRIDDFFVGRDLREILRHLAKLAQEQPVGNTQHVGLVHGGNFLAARHRAFKGTPRNALAALGGDAAYRHRHVLGRHELADTHVHIAVGVKAFGAFAKDDEINWFSSEADAKPRLGRAYVGVEVELGAHFARRIDAALIAVRVIKV